MNLAHLYYFAKLSEIKNYTAAANPGQVFTRGQIYEHIWGADSDVDESSITVFMRKIREKIEDNPSQPKYLLTVWRVGYKFAERV